MKQRIASCIVAFSLLLGSVVQADEMTFADGSLIIPMDIEYQDEGMLEAFGLLYQLLLNDITIHWVINQDKDPGGMDFLTSAVDTATADAIDGHEYRGGPFVIEASQADEAMPIIEDWQQQHVTAVHSLTTSFTGYVKRTLTAAPTIGVFADGNEDIAFGYLNSAGVPDSLGQAWPDAKDNTAEYPGYPDVLDVDEIRGPTTSSNTDGILFDDGGLPAYCELMTMHWGVNDADDDAIAEMREFLYFPTHLFAECQAVNALENSPNGYFLTPNGYLMDNQPTAVDELNPHLPFAQMDGEFETVGGSEPSYTLPDGDSYYDEGVVMLTEAGTPIGTRDVWMTGYIDGICDIDPVLEKGDDDEECDEGVGKVSYLAGHEYNTNTPISANPDSQGTRLFLNSLFEADCVTTFGQPIIDVVVTGPEWTPDAQVSYSIKYSNTGNGVAYDLELTQQLHQGMSFQDSDVAPSSTAGDSVSWNLGNFGPLDSVTITSEVEFASYGNYETSATLEYRVGQNGKSADSNTVLTVYSAEPPDGDGDGDGGLDGGQLNPGSSGCGCETAGTVKAGPSLVQMLLSTF